MVTRLDLADAGTDLFHDASTFVPDDHGKANGGSANREVPIGMAQSGGHELDQHFTLFRLVQFEFLDHERTRRPIQHRRSDFHYSKLLSKLKS